MRRRPRTDAGLRTRPALLAVLALAAAAPAGAHEGPPYPVLVDRAAGPWTVSVWADPDVGIGTFFVQLEGGPSGPPPGVGLEVRPVSGRLPAARAGGGLQPDGSYKAEIPFDREERWSVKVIVAGSGARAEAAFEVEVTPPGYGRWDLLIYFVPFLLLGGVWALAALRRGQAAARGTPSGGGGAGAEPLAGA